MITAHFFDYGYYYCPKTLNPLIGYGRMVTRYSVGYPRDCYDVVISHLASHNLAYQHLLNDRQALFILPYKSEKIIVSRRCQGAPEFYGDANHGAAMIIDASDFANSPIKFAPLLQNFQSNPITFKLNDDFFTKEFPPLKLELEANESHEIDSNVITLMRGAILSGATLRLDTRYLTSENDFIAHFCAMLATLPCELRANISAATNLNSQESTIRISWNDDGFGLCPESPLAAYYQNIGSEYPTSTSPTLNLNASDFEFITHYPPLYCEKLLMGGDSFIARFITNRLRDLSLNFRDAALILECIITAKLHETAEWQNIYEKLLTSIYEETEKYALITEEMIQILCTSVGLVTIIRRSLERSEARFEPMIKSLLAFMETHDHPSTKRIKALLLPRNIILFRKWGNQQDHHTLLIKALKSATLEDKMIEPDAANVIASDLAKHGHLDFLRAILAHLINRSKQTDYVNSTAYALIAAIAQGISNAQKSPPLLSKRIVD